MPTFFVTISLLMVTLLSLQTHAEDCKDLSQQSVCYDIEGTESAEAIAFKSGSKFDPMLVASDLAHNQMDSLILVSAKPEDSLILDPFDQSIYQSFTRANELYFRFAYKILDRNNFAPAVVITRD